MTTQPPPTTVAPTLALEPVRQEPREVRGIKGELYPCKPDIFAATYERVEPT